MTPILAPGEKITRQHRAPVPAATRLTQELLEPSPRLTWDLLELVQSAPAVDRRRLVEQLVAQPEPLGRTGFRFKRGGIAGVVTGFQEELRHADVDNATASNSLSIQRKMGPRQDAVSGKSSFLPFQPGGAFRQTPASQELSKRAALRAGFQNLHQTQGLYDVPPGMSRGLSGVSADAEGLHDIEAAAGDDGDSDGEGADGDSGADEHATAPQAPAPRGSGRGPPDHAAVAEIDEYMPLDYMMQAGPEEEPKRNWAHVVDLDHEIENFREAVPNMARTWPFELDTFQKEAVYHLEQGDSVFVAAHTSAGKTVVAEYAIAMAARNMTKTIYTSPIKALSNQKFRDFKATFKDMDVGLITGDVQINPDANCLIMTTEILRSMLYRGADLIRDVEFVVFDEVHYVNDIERGVVWEEVIIMLPDHVKYILLSATVPNTFEFANWVGRTKRKDMYVISTPKRPVPLEIFVWAKNDLYKAIDAHGVFSETEFRRHKDVLAGDKKDAPPPAQMGSGSRRGPGGTARGGNRGGGRGAARGGRGALQPRAQFARDGPSKSTWTGLVQYLSQKKLLPAVIFVFSKKRCEEYVDTLGGVSFCNARERSEIHVFLDRAVARLKKEDRELPQILKVRDLLGRGIAVHHGGLLPIVKECIEILFSRSLIKVLFATETFAMGLNLPTRTVVFCELRKHDGRGFRNLHPGEFTQMAGRAGRRGLDTTGTVIVMAYKQPLQPTDFKDVTMGRPTKLSSQFRLTYNMILNLLRIEALRVEEMIKHSFSENSTQTLMPEHRLQVEELSAQLGRLAVDGAAAHSGVYALVEELRRTYGQLVDEVQRSAAARNHLLKVGKLMVFEDEDRVVRMGAFLKSDPASQRLVFLTFDHGAAYEASCRADGLPYIPHRAYLQAAFSRIVYSGDLRVTSVPCGSVQFASTYNLKTSVKAILNNDSAAVAAAVETFRTVARYQYKLTELPFSRSVHMALHGLLDARAQLMAQFCATDEYLAPGFKDAYRQLKSRETLEHKIASLNRLISDENLELLPDYEQRLKVLQQLEFIDRNQNVVLKGRVACEINSGWELVLTELLLDNFLGDFEPEEIVALLSCFVYEGRTKDDEDPPITPRLEKGKAKILAITERLLKIYAEHQVLLTSEEEEFLERKRFALVNVVYEWARGMTFSDIMQISVESEGTIVRVITRLDEICRQVKNAALIVGDSTLHSKMSEAQERIKRDIVFCASLYI